MSDSPHHPRVQIHYRRIPDQERIYDQRVVLEREDVIITLSQPLDLDAPMVRPDGRVMLERGSLALWFTFPDAWHDIGRFHRADGSETGLYANVLTPPRLEGEHWYTTDLFLDIWWPAEGDVELLDEDEFDEATRLRLLDPETARRAIAEARAVIEGAHAGRWPPDVVREWPLERALEQLESR